MIYTVIIALEFKHSLLIVLARQESVVRVRSIVPPTVPGSIVANHVDHDVAKAKALLAEAGYPDGIDLTLTYAGIYWWMEPVAIQLKNQWAEAGIRLTLSSPALAGSFAPTISAHVANRSDWPTS